jgi:hypothetical protein
MRSCALLQRDPGTAHRAVHARRADVQQLADLLGGEPEHVAQEERGPLPGRKRLDRGQQCEPHALANVVSGSRLGRVRRQLVEPRIGVRREHGRLVARRLRHGTIVESGKADVRRDPVEPGAEAASALEARKMAPRPQQGLLERVLCVVDRPEHPVAVHVQLPPVLVGEVAKSRLVTRAGCCDERRLGH